MEEDDAMEIEGMTVDDLLAWANGLGICAFERQGGEEIACEGRNVHIRLHFGRFADGGGRYVSFDALDNRDGSHHGVGAPLRTLDDAARYIELYAERLGLANGQLTLF